jgi:sialate O-acetylesterase
MVLQQTAEPMVWGWAEASTTVSITIQGHQVSTEVDDEGKWQLKLPELKAGGPYEMTVSSNNDALTIKDILIGEVWVGSGQSNMQWSMERSDNAESEIAKADFPEIRLFYVPRVTAEEPQDDVEARWVVCTPENAAEFSAVLYYFGKEIHEKQNIPIGLIHTSWGGTPAESWTSSETMAAYPDIDHLDKVYDQGMARYKVERPQFDQQIAAVDDQSTTMASEESIQSTWDILVIGSGQTLQNVVLIDKKDGKLDVGIEGRELKSSALKFENGTLKWSYSVPAISHEPIDVNLNFIGDAVKGSMNHGNETSQIVGTRRMIGEEPPKLLPPRASHRPSALYNAMLSPLMPYSIKGAIWYQGESNVSRAKTYRTLFPAMINDWRAKWGQGDFPFYFVQIAPYNYGAPEESASAELREAQFMALGTKNTGMAITSDIGNVDDIHPTNKLDVGKRLALWALAKDYGHADLVYSGPLYKSMEIEGDKIRIHFDHVGSGLVAKNGTLTDFLIAGEDQKFIAAKAIIDGETILVSSEGLSAPAAVRFGWANSTEPNLFNSEGLPATTFRTDDWKGVTD